MSFFSKLLEGSPETYADRVGQGPQLLTPAWTLCAHDKGFWHRSISEVSDDSGSYLRQVGDCKGLCKRPVDVILSLK
jgi:hypothetical protein